MKTDEFLVCSVPTSEIKFFVRRAREQTAYGRLKESIANVGLKTPIGVRDITDRPKSKRKAPSGNYYKYELVYGQGRLQAFKELGIDKIPSIVVDVKEEEIVGRFLAENMLRRKLSWKEKAKLIEYDVSTNGLDYEQVSNKYSVSVSHAKKCLRVLNGVSKKVLDKAEEKEFGLGLTEKLVKITKEDQDVVIDVFDEEKLDKSAITHLVDAANKQKKQGKSVTKDSLKQAVADINDELRSLRSRYKLKRMEHSLGPQNLFQIFSDPDILRLAGQNKVDVEFFTKG